MNGGTIRSIRGRRLWDSRGRPTVEAEVTLQSGAVARAIAPAGASRGSREALDLRDGGGRLGGMDVGHALANLNGPMAAALIGLDAADQAAIDARLLALDPSALKDRMGGNAMVALSLACLHAGSAAAGVPLWHHIAALTGSTPGIPLPEIQIFGGGAHAGRRVDVQDFMVMVPGAASFAEALEVTAEIYAAAGDLMKSAGKLAGVADEGGWWPAFDHTEQALDTLTRAIEKAGETPGDRVVISLDIAASEFGHGGRYRLAHERRDLDSGQLIDLLAGWIDAYPIASVEDPLAEDDTEGLVAFTARFGGDLQIIGDDCLVTNAALIGQLAGAGGCNAALIKVNQAGTVTEALAALSAARRVGWRAVVSARSGESEDVSISHLAVGTGAGQLKVGSFARSERMAKWNECLRIAEHPAAGAFVGGAPLAATWWGRGQAANGGRR